MLESLALGPVAPSCNIICGTTDLQGLHMVDISVDPRPDKRRICTFNNVGVEYHLDEVSPELAMDGVCFSSGQMDCLAAVCIKNVSMSVLGP